MRPASREALLVALEGIPLLAGPPPELVFFDMHVCPGRPVTRAMHWTNDHHQIHHYCRHRHQHHRQQRHHYVPLELAW